MVGRFSLLAVRALHCPAGHNQLTAHTNYSTVNKITEIIDVSKTAQDPILFTAAAGQH